MLKLNVEVHSILEWNSHHPETIAPAVQQKDATNGCCSKAESHS